MKLKVALSNCHNGQICYPVVDATAAGRNRVVVTLPWVDQSIAPGYAGPEYKQSEFAGTSSAAESWLAEQGIVLDAEGIHGWHRR